MNNVFKKGLLSLSLVFSLSAFCPRPVQAQYGDPYNPGNPMNIVNPLSPYNPNNPTHPLNPLNPLSPTNPNGVYYPNGYGAGDTELTPRQEKIFLGAMLGTIALLSLALGGLMFSQTDRGEKCLRKIKAAFKGSHSRT